MPRQVSGAARSEGGGGGLCTVGSPQGIGIPVPFHAAELSGYGWPSRSMTHWGGHEATETGLAYAPVSQAHGHNLGGGRGGIQLAAPFPPRDNIRQNVGA